MTIRKINGVTIDADTLDGDQLSAITTAIATAITNHSDVRTGIHGRVVIRKSADQIVNNSDTLVNDTHLVLPIGANDVWLVKLTLLYNAPSVNSDLKLGFAYPTNCIITWATVYFSTTGSFAWIAQTNPLGTPTVVLLTQTSTSSAPLMIGTLGIQIIAIVANGANAGNINFQWAQNTATAEDTKLLANSILEATRLA